MPDMKRKFHSVISSHFLRTATLWNRLLRWYFPVYNNLNLLKSRSNHSHNRSFLPPPLPLITHLIHYNNFNSNSHLWVALKPFIELNWGCTSYIYAVSFFLILICFCYSLYCLLVIYKHVVRSYFYLLIIRNYPMSKCQCCMATEEASDISEMSVCMCTA